MGVIGWLFLIGFIEAMCFYGWIIWQCRGSKRSPYDKKSESSSVDNSTYIFYD